MTVVQLLGDEEIVLRALREVQKELAAYTEAKEPDHKGILLKVISITDKGEVVEAGDRLGKRLGLPSIAFYD